MLMIMFLVFLGVFAVVALLLVASSTGASQRSKQFLVSLQAALATSTSSAVDAQVDLRKNEMLSQIPWINRVLMRIEFAPKLRLMLYQAELKWTAGGMMLMCFGLFVLTSYAVYWKSGAWLLSLIAGVVASTFPFLFMLFKRSRRFGKFEKGLPEALDLMVSALRVGHSLVAALGLVTRECEDPIGGEFRICFDEQNYGLELRTAMDNLVTRMPLQDLKIATTAILIQRESGGNLAEVLDKTSHVIRERFRLKRQVATHTAQGRMTGWILTLLPVFLGIGLYILNPSQMSVLWHRDIGIKLLYASGGMTFVGGLIIRKIVNMEV